MSIGEFSPKLINLLTELTNPVNVTTCDCKRCTCREASKIIEVREEDKVHQFLMGSDDKSIQQKEVKFSHLIPFHLRLNLQHDSTRRASQTRNSCLRQLIEETQPWLSQQLAKVEKRRYKIGGHYGHEAANCYEVC